jgi:hypothetical protein
MGPPLKLKPFSRAGKSAEKEKACRWIQAGPFGKLGTAVYWFLIVWGQPGLRPLADTQLTGVIRVVAFRLNRRRSRHGAGAPYRPMVGGGA